MTPPFNRLTLEFLDWVARRPRTYAEAMEAWRTTCPRLTVWEDALMAGLIRVDGGAAPNGSLVTLTVDGRAALGARDASSSPSA